MENEQGWTPPSDAEVVETKNWTPPSDAIADEPLKKKASSEATSGEYLATPLQKASTSQSEKPVMGFSEIPREKIVEETPKKVETPKPSINKKKFDEYNRTYNEYRSANEKYTSKRDEVFEINSPTITSTEGLIRSFTEPNRTIESVLNQQLSLENDLKKRKSSFYNATKDLSSEIDTQLDLLAKENGGWDKFVKPLGIADVDKVRDAVDGFLEKNNIPTDSPVAYKLRNQMKAKAEFKKIEPEIDVKFETEYRKKYGLSPDEDIQKEYGLKAGEVEGIKQAKLELEKKRAVENEALKKEFTPELKAIGDNYTLKTKELNSQIENDQEIYSYANSLMKQEFDKYQNLVNQGKMTVEQANAEMQSAEKTKETKAKVVEMVNKKYSKAFEGEFNAYQKQLNEVNSRYNSVYRRQEAARLEQANKKIGEEINKFKGTYKPSKEILERRESLYKDAYDAVALRYGTARENVGRELGHLRQLQAAFSGLGGGIKGYGQFFDNKFLYDVGESMEANNLIEIPESKEFSDWLDADKLIVGSSNIIGRMFPMMGVSTVVGLTTENWGLAARMAAGSVTGWVTEGADMAGTVKGEVLEASGDPVEADKAANSMWRSHIYSMPLYTLSSIPYIGGLSTKIAKKIAPSLFKEAQVGARRTFGQYLKQTGVAAAVSGVAEVAEEVPQEFKQGIDEAAIRNGVEIKTIADQLKVLREGASRKGFKETVVQVVPSTLIMGSSPVFVSESAKQAKNKYYENKVDNYLNGLSINEALSTSPEQYIFNTLSEKGKNFTGTLINTLYTSGNINQQEYDALANKLVGMDNFQSWLKKNKAEGSATQNIVGYKLYGQYQEAKNELDASTEELGRGILEDKVKKAKEEFESYYKGEGTNAVILTMGDGKQFVFSPEEMNFALQFENIRAGIRDKNIAVSVYNKKGQEAIMEGTLNEMNILFQEKPLEETEVEVSDATNPATSQLQKFTSPTEDNYGTINRNDGKGIVTLTKEEYLNELQGKITTLESSIDAIDNEQSKAVVYEQVNELNKEKAEILKREIKPQDEIRNTDNNIRPQVESPQQEINIKPIEVIAGEEQDNADGGVAKIVQGDGQGVEALKSVESTTYALGKLNETDFNKIFKLVPSDYQINVSQIGGINKSISELYHESKANNSNPQLVEAVEQLLNTKPSPIKEGEVVSESELNKKEQKIFTNSEIESIEKEINELDYIKRSGEGYEGELTSASINIQGVDINYNASELRELNDINKKFPTKEVNGTDVNWEANNKEQLKLQKTVLQRYLDSIKQPNLPQEKAVGDGQGVDAKKIEIEKRRQEELYNSLTKEDKEFVDNVRNKFGDEKANKQIKNKALNTSEGNKLLEKHKAEDTLDNIDSTIEERVAARYSLQGGHPFNVAQVSDITKSINNIKKGDSLSATEKEIKLIYDAELKAVGKNVEVVTPKENEALRDVESTAAALNELTKDDRNANDNLFSLTPSQYFGSGNNWRFGNESVADAYHADKAAGKETELTKAVEEVLSPKPNLPQEYVEGNEKSTQNTAQDIEFGTAFQIQDATAENTVGKEKDLWGKSQVWRERIENAGDILRELSSRGDRPDVGYLMEKVKKIRDWISESKKGYTPIGKSIKTLEEFEKTNLKWSDAVDSREYLEKFNSNILNKIRKEYEAIPTYTNEQRLALDLVLDLINNNIEGLELKLNNIEEISTQIKKNGSLPIIKNIKLSKAQQELQTPKTNINENIEERPLLEKPQTSGNEGEVGQASSKLRTQENAKEEVADGSKSGYNPKFKTANKVLGEETTIEMPNGETREAEYMVVESDDILASHNESSFNDTIGFPKTKDGRNANSRNYKGDKSAQLKVDDNAKNLKPSIVISDTATTDGGVPIISQEGIVVSGNGRTMAIKLSQKIAPEKYQAYKADLLKRAAKFGLDPNEVAKMKNPILVKVDKNIKDYSVKTFDEYNGKFQKEESPIDKAIKRSSIIQNDEKLKDRILSIIGRHETMSDLFDNKADRKELFDFLVANDIILKQETPKYLQENGEFTPDGKDLINDVLIATILSPETLEATSNVKAFRNKIINALPVLTVNYKLGNNSLETEINEAILLQSKIATMGSQEEFWRHLKQLGMFETANPNTVIINRMINNGAINFKKFIVTYNKSMEVDENNLFGGDQVLTKQQVIDNLKQSNLNENEKQVIANLEDLYAANEEKRPSGNDKMVGGNEAKERVTQPTATPETKAAIDVYNRLKENNDTTTRKEYKALPESIKRVLDNIVNINKQLEQNKLITKKGNCP